MQIRILLVDSHDSYRRDLRRLLNNRRGLEVVAHAANGRDAMRLAVREAPEVVVMDSVLPDISGADLTMQIRSALPSTVVLALSLHSETRFVEAMLNAGAATYLQKFENLDELVEAIWESVDGRVGPGKENAEGEE